MWIWNLFYEKRPQQLSLFVLVVFGSLKEDGNSDMFYDDSFDLEI